MKKRLYDIHIVYELEDEDEFLEGLSDKDRATEEATILKRELRGWEITPEMKEIQVVAKTVEEG